MAAIFDTTVILGDAARNSRGVVRRAVVDDQDPDPDASGQNAVDQAGR